MVGTETRTISAPAAGQALDLADGGRDIAGVGIGHALHGNGRIAAHRDRADMIWRDFRRWMGDSACMMITLPA